MRRRTLLAGLSAIPTAGCLRLQDSDPSQDTDTPTPDSAETPESDDAIHLEAAWPLPDDDLVDVATGGGDFFLLHRTDSQLYRVTPAGDRVIDGVSLPQSAVQRSRDGDGHWLVTVDESGLYLPFTGDDGDGALLISLDPETGSEQWRHVEPADGLHDQITTLTVSEGAVVYGSGTMGDHTDMEPTVGSLDTETGEIRWQLDLAAEFLIGLVATADRFALQTTDRLAVYDRNTREMVAEHTALAHHNPIIEQDGRLYFAQGQELQALSMETGDPIWVQHIEGTVNTGPVLQNDLLVCGTAEGTVPAFNPDSGEPQWDSRIGGTIERRPILDADLVWTLDERGQFTAITQSNGDHRGATYIGRTTVPAIQDGVLIHTDSEDAVEFRFEND